MTALSPGASPPPVEISIRTSARRGNEAQNLPRLRVAPEGLLRERQASVHGDLEDAARGGHQPDLGVRKFALQLSRQTGGSRFVVSNDAVFDDDPHAGLQER